MRSIFAMIISFLISANLEGQLDISGGFTQDTIVIGDHAEFSLSLEIDGDVEVLAIPTFFIDSIYSALQSIKAQVDTTEDVIPKIADFEVISTGGFQDLNGDGLYTSDEMNWNISTLGNKTLLVNTFTILPWDPGETIVVYPPVIYSLNGEQDQMIREGQMRIFVAPPRGLSAEQDSLQLAPIKTIKEEKANLSDFLILFILIGTAIVLGLAYWLFVKYFKKQSHEELEEIEEEIQIPPHIVAIQKLKDLRTQELWQQGDIKKYQSELTYIIREYLEGRYGVQALESTTAEVIRELARAALESDNVLSVQRILQVADLVKFAKATPADDIHESFMNEAIELVHKTKELEDFEPSDD